MLLFGLDLETTGLDTNTARITEFGVVIWDTDLQKPILIESILVKQSEPLPKEILELCPGITDQILADFGVSIAEALERINYLAIKARPAYIVAHNGENYDKPLLFAEIARLEKQFPALKSTPWIDTRTDLPFEKEPKSRSLNHLAADHGFLNPFAHRAAYDVSTMLKVLSAYSIEKIIEFQRQPWVVLRAIVSYDDRQKAKDLRFGWEKAGEQTYPKCWVKKVKENQIPKELEAAQKIGVQVVRI